MYILWDNFFKSWRRSHETTVTFNGSESKVNMLCCYNCFAAQSSLLGQIDRLFINWFTL